MNKIVELQRDQDSPTSGANVFCGVGLMRSWGQQVLSMDDPTHRKTLQRRQELQQGPPTETRNENPQLWNSKMFQLLATAPVAAEHLRTSEFKMSALNE